MKDRVPDVVTQDRSNIHEIIEEMLENPDEIGIYHTTKTYNKLEELLKTVRIEALGWTWTMVCILLDKEIDPRKYEQSQLIDEINKDLNPPWEYKELL